MADFELFGVEALKAALEGTVVAAAEANKKIVRRAQIDLEATTKKAFTGSHKKGTRTTAPPDHPPDVVTGALRRSITSSPVETKGLSASGTVYPAAIYARIQELGGVGGRGAHLPARPYLAPSLTEAAPRMGKIAAEEWAKVMPL